jgi:pimeloyl-[acyl-carrier protein] synthase
MPADSAFDVDLSRAGEMRNGLLAEIGKLRELERVHWSPASHCWMVSQHQDIVEAFGGTLPLSNHKMDKSSFGELSPEEARRRLPNLTRYPQFWITESDPPNHTRLRKLLSKAFGKSVVEGVRPFAQARVAYLMSKMRETPELEFNEGVARQLPGVVILKLLGLPDELYGHLKEWATSFTVALASALPKVEWLDRAERSMVEMNEIFRAQVAERRAHPGSDNDLLSLLLAARDRDDRLSEEELLGILQLIIVAGHDTTSNSMALGTVALAGHPDSWRYMREHPESTAQSVLEIMRYSAMSAAMPRVVREDFIWHDKRLKKGDIVFLMIAAGNRDPRAFAEPERLDLTRNNDNSLTFAPGLHHCIGHLLAKMQLNEYFGALVQHFDGATMLDNELNFLPQLVFRGVSSLNMRFHPRINR